MYWVSQLKHYKTDFKLMGSHNWQVQIEVLPASGKAWSSSSKDFSNSILQLPLLMPGLLGFTLWAGSPYGGSGLVASHYTIQEEERFSCCCTKENQVLFRLSPGKCFIWLSWSHRALHEPIIACQRVACVICFSQSRLNSGLWIVSLSFKL